VVDSSGSAVMLWDYAHRGFHMVVDSRGSCVMPWGYTQAKGAVGMYLASSGAMARLVLRGLKFLMVHMVLLVLLVRMVLMVLMVLMIRMALKMLVIRVFLGLHKLQWGYISQSFFRGIRFVGSGGLLRLWVSVGIGE